MRSSLIDFYYGDATDSEGRSLDEILGWDYIKLELVHDFVQWLFPLPEASQFNDDAPILTSHEIDAFRRDPQLRERLLQSFEKMLGFYGFMLVREPEFRIEESDLFEHRRHVLYGGFNHNHLRITRILRSLTILGLPAAARAFLERLIASDRDGTLPSESLKYWQKSVADL